MITPTVGRVIHYYPAGHEPTARCGKDQPHAALIAHVHNDRCVNLAVFDSEGKSYSRCNVTLVQPKDECPEGAHAMWMPYQIETNKQNSTSAEPYPVPDLTDEDTETDLDLDDKSDDSK